MGILSKTAPSLPFLSPLDVAAIPELPQGNPIFRFSFQLSPASKLKHALEALSDVEFNKQGTGLIEVTENGLEITVRNPKTDVVAYLRLKASGLIDFRCDEPVYNKMVHLNQIFKKLVLADDEDTVSVRNLDGSDNLCFVFGSAPPREFAVKLQEIDEDFKKVPDITYCCEAVVLSEHLRHMIPHILESTGPEIVSLDITEERLNIVVGECDWIYDYDIKKGGVRGMAPGQQHDAWFLCRHSKSLKKASFLAVGFLLCIVMDPPNTIMMRFNLKELGDLVFFQEATMILTNSNELPDYEAQIGLGQLASVASII